jgi:transposase-like protein
VQHAVRYSLSKERARDRGAVCEDLKRICEAEGKEKAKKRNAEV